MNISNIIIVWFLLAHRVSGQSLEDQQQQQPLGFTQQLQLNEGLYRGQTRNGVPHGFGSIVFRSDDQSGRLNYTGGFSRGSLSGVGTMIWRNGARYSGDIRNNIFEGKGEYFWPNGDRYSGQYQNGKRNGVGEMRYADGDSYTGSWREGQYHGQGVYRWKDGNVYSGTWVNGMAEGRGVFRYGSGDRKGEWYEGQFRNGVKHGFGRYNYPDGRYFEGGYRNGRRNGRGRLRLSASDPSSILEGVWADGVLKEQFLTETDRIQDVPSRLQSEQRPSELTNPSQDSNNLSNNIGFSNDIVTSEPSSSTTEEIQGVFNNVDQIFGSIGSSSSQSDDDSDNEADSSANTLNNENSLDLDSIRLLNGIQQTLSQSSTTSTPSTQSSTSVGANLVGIPQLSSEDTRISGFQQTTTLASITPSTTLQSTLTPGFQRLVTDRGIYVGEVRDGVPHGNGTFVYSSQSDQRKNYTGTWRFGRRNGRGEMFWDSGDSYIGDWLEDLPHGQGQYRWADGHNYIGDYQFGAPEGRGRFVTVSGDIYEGEFVDGLPNGEGEFSYGSGEKRLDKYVGHFVNGAFDGEGRYFFANGDRYEGEFRGGQRHGKGVMFFTNGGFREGSWKNDRPVGEIRYHRPDGTVEVEIYEDPDSSENDLISGRNAIRASMGSKVLDKLRPFKRVHKIPKEPDFS